MDIESTAQRSTLQEQRTHIEILDKALNNAQTSIIRMEEEVRVKQDYVLFRIHVKVTQPNLNKSTPEKKKEKERLLKQDN